MAIWDPITQTGHTQGTPRNWTTTIAAQTGMIRTATTSNVNTVISQCVPGDVVFLSNGTYGQITVNVSGTSTKKIVIVAANPGTYGTRNVHISAARIIINGAHIILGGFKYSWGTAPSNLIQINNNSIEVTDCDVQDVTVTTGNPRCIIIDDLASNTHIHHCRFINIYGIFAIVQDVTYPSPYGTGTLIEYNTFQNVLGYNGSTTGGQTVQIGNSANDGLCLVFAIVRYNKFTNCIQSEMKVSNCTIYRNYFADAPKLALSLRQGTYNTAEGNYFIGCDRGISVWDSFNSVINNVFIDTNGIYSITLGEGSLSSQSDRNVYPNYQHNRPEDALIANNVIINSTQRAIYMGRPQTGFLGPTHPEPYSPIRIKIINNVIYQSVGVAIYLQLPDTVAAAGDNYPTNVAGYHKYVDCEIKNNCVYVTGTAVIGDNSSDGGSPPGYINWNHATLTSGSVISGNIETNPLLTSTYRVLPTSPCINTGVAYSKNGHDSTTMSDWDGDARTIGAQPDMGVDEFGLNVHLPTVGTLFMLGGQVVSLGNPYANFEMVPGQCALLLNGNFPLKGKSKTTETGTLYFNGGNSGKSLDPEGSVFYLNGGTLSGNFVWSAVASNTTTWCIL